MNKKETIDKYTKKLVEENKSLRKQLTEREKEESAKRIKELESMPLKESELTLLRQYYKRQTE